MTAATKDLVIEQGSTFVWGMTLFDIEVDDDGVETVIGPRDLTDCKARMQIRQRRGAEIQIDANTENDQIVLGRVAYGDTPGDDDPTNGRLMVVITDDETDVITIKKGVYDLELVEPDPAPSGFVIRLYKGAVTVDPNVTQVIAPAVDPETSQPGDDVVL